MHTIGEKRQTQTHKHAHTCAHTRMLTLPPPLQWFFLIIEETKHIRNSYFLGRSRSRFLVLFLICFSHYENFSPRSFSIFSLFRNGRLNTDTNLIIRLSLIQLWKGLRLNFKGSIFPQLFWPFYGETRKV